MVTRKRSTGQGSQGPTLKTIADLAGVSLMSVSRALNGGTISPENAARVKKAAEALGYVPNASAQRMRGGRTKTVGILMSDDFDPRTEIMAIVDGMIREMEAAGNQVLLSIARGGGKQIDHHLRGFLARGVDGIFFWNAHPSPLLERYERLGIPIIAMAFRDDECKQIPLVTFAGLDELFADLYQRMYDLGHRSAVEITRARQPAMHEQFADHTSIAWRRHDFDPERDSLVELAESLRSGVQPATVVITDFPLAAQLMGVCGDLGIDIPGDLSLVSIVDAVAAPVLRVPLSCLRADYGATGHAAAQSMLAAIEGEHINDVFVPNGMEFIERASLGPAPTKRSRSKR